MHARVAIIDFPASVPAALERSHYFFDADSEEVTHFPVCLKVLADLLTDWTIIDLVTDAQLQMWFEVSQLTSLTRMTINDPYGVFDGHDMVELQFLSQMHSMALNSTAILQQGCQILHLCSVLSYIEEQTTLFT